MTRSDAGAGLPQDMYFTVRPPCSRVGLVRHEDERSTPRRGQNKGAQLDKKFAFCTARDAFDPCKHWVTSNFHLLSADNPQPNPQVEGEVPRETVVPFGYETCARNIALTTTAGTAARLDHTVENTCRTRSEKIKNIQRLLRPNARPRLLADGGNDDRLTGKKLHCSRVHPTVRGHQRSDLHAELGTDE